MGQLSKLQAILLGGLLAGTVDIGAAALISGRSPLFICRFIAGAILGRDALEQGASAVALGVALQWAMSIVIAAIYAFASARLPALKRNWALWGSLYGVPVHFVMSYVALPLSAWRRAPRFELNLLLAENLAAMMVFGLIVAFFVSRTR
ncbi:MAG TPA: hypothetical protein VG843_07000 [Rhizomicrobium sp.]|jgi:uncharacterized membrane protein YagU involved in acid resistance|nr:hypothetical protein [Rhizomicrobium sp.]